MTKGNVEIFQGPDSYPEAILASFETDLVVVTHLLNADQIQRVRHLRSMVATQPWATNKGKIIDPLLRRELGKAIPGLSESRKAILGWLAANFEGRLNRVQVQRHAQRADGFRRGAKKAHIDASSIMSATSINLIDDQSEPTVFAAERIADATAPYAEIKESFEARQARGEELRFYDELSPGDAIIVSRGVEHAVSAGPRRSTLLIDTKSWHEWHTS